MHGKYGHLLFLDYFRSCLEFAKQETSREAGCVDKRTYVDWLGLDEFLLHLPWIHLLNADAPTPSTAASTPAPVRGLD